MKHQITPADILPLDVYEKMRGEKRAAILETKKHRRVAVGPYATFYFENYDTMWLQIQEMLRIEKGGDAQLEDELKAYNPLIPQGHELVATVMMEIEDPVRRVALLSKLGGLEHKIEIRVDGESVKGIPEQDLDYTSTDGKASSIVFVHFKFTPQQILNFRSPKAEIVLAIVHPNYGHLALLSPTVRHELERDFL